VKEIHKRSELVTLAKELRVRNDWHEPDEQEVTAGFTGYEFNNAGFDWEMSVVLMRDGDRIARVNLATLFAWACGLRD
jgi:hypothetical protein